jgi:DNA-binding NarL/FixJ family response regulator
MATARASVLTFQGVAMPDPKSDNIRLMLVEDHEVVRLGLREVFHRSHSISVIGECDTCAQAVVEAVHLKPDVVLMDLRLPDGSGVEVCREIRMACPETRVLFLTSFGDEEAVLSTIFAGASGYLMKQIDSRSLIDAVERVAKGQSILDPHVTGSFLARMGTLAAAPMDPTIQALSPQEQRILPLLAEGKTNKEIATEMGLAEMTVKSYLHSIFNKLKISRRAQAAAWFLKIKQITS